MGEEAILIQKAQARARKHREVSETLNHLLEENRNLFNYLVPNLFQFQPISTEKIYNNLCECAEEQEKWSRECLKTCLERLETISYVKSTSDGYILTPNFRKWLSRKDQLDDLKEGKNRLQL